jgi:AhpD family alkylhydroperoxidase
MRLEILERGHRIPARVFMAMARLMFRHDVDDVVKTALHRPEFFGRQLLPLVGAVLRGPSFWTPAEREQMAAHISRLNVCPFCVREHSQIARLASHSKIEAMPAQRPEVAAILPLLEKASKTPAEMSSADVRRVREAGVPEEAIVDGLHVALIFNTVNRLANAFDCTWDSDQHVLAGAKAIHRFRYRLPKFVLR